jgi:hypothetical protein
MPTSSPPPLPLDAAGLLPESAWDALQPARSYLVFAQLRDASLDASGWARHAKQFFRAELQLTRPKAYGESPPKKDAAHLLLTRPPLPNALRSVFLRPRTEEDLACAESAQGGGGLALLAKRCTMVVLVGLPEGADEDEPTLFVAAVIAGVVLGPILSPDRGSIYGVKTARGMLERMVG